MIERLVKSLSFTFISFVFKICIGMKSHINIKKIFLLQILVLTTLFSVAQKLKVSFNYLKFNIPDEMAYVELQFLFHGNGLIYNINDNGKYQALIGANISFVGKDTTIKRIYSFSSDEYTDTANVDNIYNSVRIPLPIGKCQMKISMYDKNAVNQDTLFFNDELDIKNNRNIVDFSDIIFIGFYTKAAKSDNFTRHGIEYMPYFSNFYPENIKQLTFMAEIYNSDKITVGNDFIIHSYISHHKKNKAVGEQFEQWEVAKKADMNVVFHNYKIDSLPSGNYELKIEVRDRRDTLHAYTSYYFQRSNPNVESLPGAVRDSLPYDTLKMYLDYIYPLANIEEQRFIENIKPEQYKEIEDFFEAFWHKRNKENPQLEWYKYYNQVMRVNYNYTTLKQKGYKTDRGFYYLKYGPPNDIEYNHSGTNGPAHGIEYYRGTTNTTPYEIWTYNTMKDGQVNVIFVFYNPDLATKDFRMLHSTARGEFRNDKWRQILGISDDEHRDLLPSTKDNLNKRDNNSNEFIRDE